MGHVKSLGSILNEFRKQHNVTVVELSKRTGIKKSEIYRTFAKCTSMSSEELNNWAHAIGVDVDWLRTQLDEEEDRFLDATFQDGRNATGTTRILKLLEEQLWEKNRELKEKDEQIRSLQGALQQALQLQFTLLGQISESSGD